MGPAADAVPVKNGIVFLSELVDPIFVRPVACAYNICEAVKAGLNKSEGRFQINIHPGKGRRIATDIHIIYEVIGGAGAADCENAVDDGGIYLLAF